MYFNLNPIITGQSPFKNIVDQVRDTGHSKEWKDSDGMWRCSKIDIIPRSTLKNWLLNHINKVKTLSKIAKDSTYSFTRIKKGFVVAEKYLKGEDKLQHLQMAVS